MNGTKYFAGVRQSPKKQRGHTRPRPPVVSLDEPGWLRVGNLLWLFGVSHSTLYAGIKPKAGQTSTRYPRPDGYDGGSPYWKTSTIRAFLEA